MLVLSRVAGESISIGSSNEGYLVTVLKVVSEPARVSILISGTTALDPGVLKSWTREMIIDAEAKLSDSVMLTLVDVKNENARFGINAPKESSIHRLEVYEAIMRESRRGRSDPDEGMAGSPVP